jgi:hypothetical protein
MSILPGTKRNFALAANLGQEAIASAKAEKQAIIVSLPPGDLAGLETKFPMRMNSGADPVCSNPSKTRCNFSISCKLR